jgi:hypothetical protein
MFIRDGKSLVTEHAASEPSKRSSTRRRAQSASREREHEETMREKSFWAGIFDYTDNHD